MYYLLNECCLYSNYHVPFNKLLCLRDVYLEITKVLHQFNNIFLLFIILATSFPPSSCLVVLYYYQS